MADRTVTLTVNGKRRDFPAGSTLADMLRNIDVDPRMVVVEHNREIVRERDDLARRAIGDGDVVEIVHFVGGG